MLVEVNDSGVDATHPDFSTAAARQLPDGAAGRVLGVSTHDLVDTNGHGTHVAGIIAGNGSMSLDSGQRRRHGGRLGDQRGFPRQSAAGQLFSVNMATIPTISCRHRRRR